MRSVILLAGVALAAVVAPMQPLGAQPAPAAAAESPSAAINAFFDAFDKDELARSPVSKSYRGIKDADYGKWNDYSDAGAARDHAAEQKALADMRARFAGASLDPQARLSYRLFEKQMQRAADAYAYRDYDYIFDQMNGAQSQMPAFLINIHRVDGKADAEAYVSRLNGLGPALDQLMAEADDRAKAGILPPKWVFPFVISDARNVIRGAPFEAGAAADAPLYADFKAKVAKLDLPQADKDRLVADAAAALNGSVKPAYERLIALMQRHEGLAGTDDGVWRFKDGAAFYKERLGYYTTTDLDAEQIHALGLAQVARIHGEMDAIRQRIGFKGDFKAFLAHMRTTPEAYFSNDDAGRQAYLDETDRLMREMQAKLPEYFNTLPKAPLVVKRVEAFREKSAGKAFYQRPTEDGSRPGTYYVNLYDMKAMPRTEVAALAFHEGVPGHHLQLAVSTELKDVPAFRKYGGFTAYSEGWGLYSEKLAKDMGFYTDPYSDFGRLQLELHRAIRLVVDTGLHHKRWTREQAIQYVKDNSADAEAGIPKAIERYIVYPGQATAYMVGRLKITELRERAQKQMGARFTYGGFHDAILKSGPVSLDIMEEQVMAWAAQGGAAVGK